MFVKNVILTTVILSLRRNMAMSLESPVGCSYKAGTHSVAYVTVPDETLAKKLAKGIIEQKLAACVNIIPKITSVYEWKGEIQEDNELLLMIKTRTSRVDELTKYVRENHSYDVCEVITLPIDNGNPPYLKWIGDIVPVSEST